MTDKHKINPDWETAEYDVIFGSMKTFHIGPPPKVEGLECCSCCGDLVLVSDCVLNINGNPECSKCRRS